MPLESLGCTKEMDTILYNGIFSPTRHAQKIDQAKDAKSDLV